MDMDVNNYRILQAGAYAQQNMNRQEDWQSMVTAPRDGTYVELKNTFGVAPWYCIARWTDENIAISNHGPVPFKSAHKSWVKPEGGGPFNEAKLQWRPYKGTVTDYVDPTGGMQDSAAYWRGAAAAKSGLPVDAFEKATARNVAKNTAEDGAKRGFWSWLFGR